MDVLGLPHDLYQRWACPAGAEPSEGEQSE
jgi:hypothetical protein